MTVDASVSCAEGARLTQAFRQRKRARVDELDKGKENAMPVVVSVDPKLADSCQSSSNPSIVAASASAVAVDAAAFFARTKGHLRAAACHDRALVGREDERATILRFLTAALQTNPAKPAALYISGRPGTGKTALVNQICNDLESGQLSVGCDEVKIVRINCMTLANPRSILAADFAPTCSMESNTKRTSSTRYLVVLDEIDQLMTKDQEILYEVFQWPRRSFSSVSVIGIANALDLTERFLPRLKARNQMPDVLNFQPYTVAQIQAIIQARIDIVKQELPGAQPSAFIHPLAVEMCARSGASSGDIRRSLEIMRRTIEKVEAEMTNNGGKAVVTLAHVHATSAAVSTLSLAHSSNRAFDSLNVHAKLVLTVLCMMIRDRQKRRERIAAIDSSSSSSSSCSFSSRPLLMPSQRGGASASAGRLGTPSKRQIQIENITVSKLFEAYTAVCMGHDLVRPVSRTEFTEVMSSIELSGLVEVASAAKPAKRSFGGIRLQQPMEDRNVDATVQLCADLSVILERIGAEGNVVGIALSKGLPDKMQLC